MSIKKRLNFIQYFFISFILMLCPFAASASTSASASTPILDSLWCQVDQLIEQALPKSALEKVDKIQIQSRKASDWSSYINCILHKGKIWKSYEEKPMLSMIRLLKNEILITPSPAKEVLYSILGQTLSEYYSMRRFYDHDQLPSMEIDSQNIETWDFAYLLERIKENYKLSIAENDFALKTLLQKTPLEKYETLLQSEPDANRYRPSLYDLLSYRALDKFKELQNENSLSLNDEIQTIYNNLALFHSQDSLPLAWVDLMLNKNEYLHSQNKITDAEYVKQLEIWKNKYADFPICGDLLFALANYWYEQGSKYQCTDSSSFSYRFDKKKAYHYAKEAFDKYPQSIGAKNSNLLLAQIQNTFFSLQTARVAIPEMPILGSLQYQNMDSVFILFYKLNDTNLWDYQESMEKEQWVNTYSQAFPFQDRMYGLPQTNDYQNHRVELNLGILPIGSYLCRISSSADFSQATSSSQIIQVSPLSCLIVTENGETAKGFILDRISGKGIAGASIHLLNTEFNYQTHKNTFTKVGSYPSVSDGSFVIPAKEKAKTYRLFITYKKQKLWLDETIWLRQKQEGTSEGQKMVYWFTDRAIYRPGDIVEAKGILVQNLNDSISILSSQKITSSLYSPKNQEIAKIENTSNAFGSFSLRFQIPLQGLKGRMYIQAFQSRIYFDVEDYKRPTFEVTFTDPSSSYILGDSIPVNGQALRYSGQELANAKYNYRIYRQKAQPFFRYIKSYYPSVSDKTLIQAGESTCNVSGQFALQFSSLLDSNLLLQNPRETLYQFLVEVDVRDINGEIQRGIHSFILSKTALFTYTNVEEHWVDTDSMPIAIQSMDVNGKSIPTKGHIRIYRIENAEKNWSYPRKWNEADQFIYSKTAFKALFPWDEYENSLQIETTQNRILVAEQNFIFGDSSVCFRDCQSWRQGKYQYELNVVDAKGNQAKQIGNFDFINSLHKKEIYPSYFEFVNLTPQVKWGDKVSFLLSTQQNHLWVYYELRDSENHSNGHWVQLSNEQKIIEIPLLASSKGSQNLSVFWVKNNHLFVSESNIDILRPNSNFKIQLNTFRNKIEAGNKETWEITIQNIDSTLQNKEIKEVLVSMYDASLDAFVPHHWQFSTPFIPKPYSIWNEVKYLPNFENIQIFLNTRYRSEQNYYSFQNRVYSSLNWEGFRNFGSSIPLTMYSRAGALGNKASKAMALDNSTMAIETENNTQNWERNIPLPIKTQIRNNFKETAFFYPSLLSDTNGNVRFSFGLPKV
ncbi:MAG: MG2 domain-containing protein [Bacteroidales bacterium]